MQSQPLQYGTPSPWASAPTPEHLQQIAAAKRLGTKVRRAQSVAQFSAWTTAIFAMFTIVFSLTSFWGLILGLLMAVVSVIEFRGASEIKRLDPSAPKRLALNQLAFGALLFLYGAVSIVITLYSKSDLPPELNDPQVQGMLGDTVGLIKNLWILVYASVMLAAILGPGLTAIYYYTRKRYIEEYLRETPKWILDLQRAGMSL